MNRGYPIEQLAEKSNFLESAYLLIYGSLPTKKQYNIFEGEVMHRATSGLILIFEEINRKVFKYKLLRKLKRSRRNIYLNRFY